MIQSTYGTLPDGRDVTAYILENSLLKAEILTCGATLNRLFVPDKHGKRENILLTFDSLEQRLARSAYQGETVGRYANRIANGRFALNGKKYTVTQNEENGNCLHGGGEFSCALWQANSVGDSALELTYTSPAQAHGFPGEIMTLVRYTLSGRALVIEYEARSSTDTILNLTNHAYFNLAGAPNGSFGDILSHLLKIDAQCYLPIDAASIPTGELRPVEGTAFDFRDFKPIGQDIFSNEPQLTQVAGYDHNFCNPKSIEVYEPATGRRMAVETDLPGVQLYTGNYLPALPGWGGPHSAFCLETQAWPDSPNQWPEQCLFKAGETYLTTTKYIFPEE